MVVMMMLFVFKGFVFAQNQSDMRRPISNVSPTWLVHVDVWANADPKRIIELVPEDIRPFVIFNLSLSISKPASGPYGPNVDKYTILESWIRTCAEYRAWATIQTASGWESALPPQYAENDIYEYFYKTYPNFVGYNFAEQCWGFPTETDFENRLQLFADLIKLGHKYGGYVMVSHTQTMNAPHYNAIANLKRSDAFRAAAKDFSENYISIEKYTTSRGFYDIESTCLGTFLSGYAGNYGVRFDDCGWTYIENRAKKDFPKSLGIFPIVEHAILTGQTLSDGPELTWNGMAISGDGTQNTDNGYRFRAFKQEANFTNNNLDVFRKILDGSFPIPSREEVIERTKVAYVNDFVSGDNSQRYSSEQSLFTGLYAMDGEYSNNIIWTKSTGRYPTIPTLFKEGVSETGAFEKVVTKSNYASTWPTIESKVKDLDGMFPQEYTGDIYASRMKNVWVMYNPYMGEPNDANYTQKLTSTSGIIPFKYNTCREMNISLSNYGLAVLTESKDRLDLYLNNFSDKLSDNIPLLRKDTVRIHGAISSPTYTYENRGGANAGNITISDNWDGDIYTLYVEHNGPVDVTINCLGTESDRLAVPETPSIITPSLPPVYTGILQYEAEDMDFKNIASLKQNGSLPGYTALGYSVFGANASAAMRMKPIIATAGLYNLKIKYSVLSADVNNIDLYVNGQKTANLSFPKTKGWAAIVESVNLTQGENIIELVANGIGVSDMSFDNLILESVGNVTSPSVFVSSEALNTFSYTYGGLSGNQNLSVYGNSSATNLTVSASPNFEVSLSETEGYSPAITLPDVAGTVLSTHLYVRMKSSLSVGNYNGVLYFKDADKVLQTVNLRGYVTPKPTSILYDFTKDVATTNATNPPALDVSVGIGNDATAGVISLTDTKGTTSNVFHPYTSGQKNGSGVMNLNLFPKDASDYSITWKQYLAEPAAETKVGMLLRGDVENIGDENRGYAYGLMHGYVFIVYTIPNTSIDFRIYKSTATGITMEAGYVANSSLKALIDEPMWFRASVVGDSDIELKLEYSIDGNTWNTGVTKIDNENSFKSGASQMIWGLAASSNFSLDDILFKGVANDFPTSIEREIDREEKATVVSEEFFNMMGQRINRPTKSNGYGVYIIRRKMSDGTIRSIKVMAN